MKYLLILIVFLFIGCCEDQPIINVNKAVVDTIYVKLNTDFNKAFKLKKKIDKLVEKINDINRYKNNYYDSKEITGFSDDFWKRRISDYLPIEVLYIHAKNHLDNELIKLSREYDNCFVEKQ